MDLTLLLIGFELIFTTFTKRDFIFPICFLAPKTYEFELIIFLNRFLNILKLLYSLRSHEFFLFTHQFIGEV